MRWDDSLDLDGSPYDIAFTQRFTKYHQISQDLQWLGHTEQLHWVGGLYYFGDNGGTNNPQHFFSVAANYDSSSSTKTHGGSVRSEERRVGQERGSTCQKRG